MARGDISGRTLGEVRRKAFQNALDILESFIRTNNNNGIRIQASFRDLGETGEEETIFLAQAAPTEGWAIESSFVPGGFLAVPIALAEHMLARELNENEADVEITFNENFSSFFYGTGFGEPLGYVNFSLVITHEVMHGLGFLSLINENGSFEQIELLDGSTLSAIGPYDLNLYSESKRELLVHLSQSERQEAITSVDGVVWDGTSGGYSASSCAKVIGEALMDEYPSAVDSEGRPRLYVPETWEQGSSVSHFAEDSKDLMKPSYGAEHSYFTLGILLDLLWSPSPETVPAGLAEVLEGCLADSGERPEMPEEQPEVPEETQEEAREVPEERNTASSSNSGGGCVIAGYEGTAQNTVFNVFLILLILISALIHTSSLKKS